MSEENNQNTANQNEPKNPKNTFLIITFIIALLSLCLSTYVSWKLGVFDLKSQIHQMGPDFSISKKYDKGQSMDKALATEKPIVAWFYVDWCGFCKKFAPTFDKVTKDKEVKKNLAVAFINCEAPENAELVKEYGITHFPTLFLIKGNEKLEIEGRELFAPNAVKSLKIKFIDFAKGANNSDDDNNDDD